MVLMFTKQNQTKEGKQNKKKTSTYFEKCVSAIRGNFRHWRKDLGRGNFLGSIFPGIPFRSQRHRCKKSLKLAELFTIIITSICPLKTSKAKSAI